MLRDKQNKKNSGQRLPVFPAWVYERPTLVGDFLTGSGLSTDTAVPIGMGSTSLQLPGGDSMDRWPLCSEPMLCPQVDKRCGVCAAGSVCNLPMRCRVIVLPGRGLGDPRAACVWAAGMILRDTFLLVLPPGPCLSQQVSGGH